LYQKLGVNNENELKDKIQSRISDYDFKAIADDVTPFLINQNEVKRVEKFPEFWAQVNLEKGFNH
jgi:hypothetical protein